MVPITSAGKQVRCKLDAAQFTPDRLSQGFDGQGFGKSGYAFEQDMAVGQQSDQQAIQQILLPEITRPISALNLSINCPCNLNFLFKTRISSAVYMVLKN